MPKQSDRFQWLAREFDALAESLEDCPNLEKRRQLLRRMRILIDEIDKLVIFTLKREKQETPISTQPSQPTAKS
jgi:hypothetical protein